MIYLTTFNTTFFVLLAMYIGTMVLSMAISRHLLHSDWSKTNTLFLVYAPQVLNVLWAIAFVVAMYYDTPGAATFFFVAAGASIAIGALSYLLSAVLKQLTKKLV